LGRGHLTDAQFAKYWADDKVEGVPHPHLAACEACRVRYEAFERWVDGIGDELRDEADEAFAGERLAAQQAQIVRRLETLERPARVLRFPKAARAVISGHSHARRWVTVAAAAGLLAGLSLAQIVPLHHAVAGHRTIQGEPVLTASDARELSHEIVFTTSQSDDELLSDAFTRSHQGALGALDDMTPHVRDIVDTSK